MTEITERARTVSDKLAEVRLWRQRLEDVDAMPEDRRQKAIGKAERIMARLREFDGEMELLTVGQAAHSNLLTAQERFIIRWQYRSQLALAPYEDHRIQMLEDADDEHLDLLARLWPEDVEAIRLWRNEPGWSDRIRGLPIDVTGP